MRKTGTLDSWFFDNDFNILANDRDIIIGLIHANYLHSLPCGYAVLLPFLVSGKNRIVAG